MFAWLKREAVHIGAEPPAVVAKGGDAAACVVLAEAPREVVGHPDVPHRVLRVGLDEVDDNGAGWGVQRVVADQEVFSPIG